MSALKLTATCVSIQFPNSLGYLIMRGSTVRAVQLSILPAFEYYAMLSHLIKLSAVSVSITRIL